MTKTSNYIETGYIPAGNELQDDKVHIYNLYDHTYMFRVNMDDYPENEGNIHFFFMRLNAIAKEAMGGYVDSEFRFHTPLTSKQVKDWFKEQFNPDVLVFEGFDLR